MTMVRVTHRYTASPERVFDAWLSPDMIGKWMFGAAVRDEEILRIEVDARVGGRFSFLVRRQGEEIDHIGRYLEIDRPRRLVFTFGIAGFGGDSQVTIEIVPAGSGCELTLTQEIDPAWAQYADRSREGWTKMLAMLEKVIQ